MAENDTFFNGTHEEDLSEVVATIKHNMDSFFLISMGILVFLMQCGFAFLEAGAVRSKNAVNILIKNMLDCLIGGLAYWAIGWAVAYGEGGNEFIGTSQFFNYHLDHKHYPAWFFQFVFAATAATIVSGSIAERCHFGAYFVYSVLITGWVYPPVTHWAWDPSGWLAVRGYKDFAGSGVVHVLGGTCAFVGCWVIGPRLGRFTKDGKVIDMPGHSVPLAGLGGFILLFGFLAFNGGSQLTITNPGDPEKVGLAIVNTIIGGCGGGLTSMCLYWLQTHPPHKWSYLMTLNGALTGMVAQCAGCNLYEPWAAFVIGFIAGGVFLGLHIVVLEIFKMDDPLDACAVHLGGGMLGVLCVPFFMHDKENDSEGIFWEGHLSAPWYTLGMNIGGLVAIMLWAGFWSFLIFGGLKMIGILRIDRETEFRGNDLIKHGESAYPRDAWVEMQYANSSKEEGGMPANFIGLSDTPGEDDKAYNNAHEMFPTFSKLRKHSGKTLSGIIHIGTGTQHQTNGAANHGFTEEEEEPKAINE